MLWTVLPSQYTGKASCVTPLGLGTNNGQDQKHSPLGPSKGKRSVWNVLLVQVKEPCTSWEATHIFFSCIQYNFIFVFKSAPLEQGGVQVWKPRVSWKCLSLGAKLFLFDLAKKMGNALMGPLRDADCEASSEPAFTQQLLTAYNTTPTACCGCPHSRRGVSVPVQLSPPSSGLSCLWKDVLVELDHTHP